MSLLDIAENIGNTKINLKELRDCQNILSSRDELITTEEKKLLAEIKELVARARCASYCDFRYELMQALEGNNSVGAKAIRDKYFPAPVYDPSRE